MRTGQEYLESLRDGRRRLRRRRAHRGRHDAPQDAWLRPAIARYYDLHLDPEHQDELTFVDDDGNRQSMHWFLPAPRRTPVRRRRYHEFSFRHFKGGIFTRPPRA